LYGQALPSGFPEGLPGHELTALSAIDKLKLWLKGRPDPDVRFRTLSEGYLSFILYGYALAFRACPEGGLWKDRAWQEFLQHCRKFLLSEESPALSSANPYCWSYNPTGIEVEFVLETFGLKSSGTSDLLQEQFDRHLNFKTGLMDRNSPETSCARIYEVSLLQDRLITVPG
jgi:hypothetical protein